MSDIMNDTSTSSNTNNNTNNNPNPAHPSPDNKDEDVIMKEETNKSNTAVDTLAIAAAKAEPAATLETNQHDPSFSTAGTTPTSTATATTTTTTPFQQQGGEENVNNNHENPNAHHDYHSTQVVVDDSHLTHDDEDEDVEDDEEGGNGSGGGGVDASGEEHSHKPKRRRVVTGEKADLYSHFSTLNEKAYTKGGKDLGLYLCICKYCQSAYERAKADWLALDPSQRPISEPQAPQPFPRTRRYCVNHQKQCPHIPKDTAMAVVGAALSNAPKLRTRASSTFHPVPAGGGGGATPTTSATTTSAPNTTAGPQIGPGATAATTTASRPSMIPAYGTIHPTTSITPSTFEVYVAKDTFKFNAAHFVAFEGYRERLHGHNYTVSVRLQGSHTTIGPDGYVIDYGNIKKVCKEVCKELNEHFLCPSYSNVLKITHLPGHQMVRIDCPMDGTYFEFPTQDCKFLPIVHATTEELAIYLWSVVMERLNANFLLQRGIASMELTVAEAPGQQATFRYPVHSAPLDVRKFIQGGALVPTPCLDTAAGSSKKRAATSSCGPDCPGCVTDTNQTNTAPSTVAEGMPAGSHYSNSTVSPEALLSLTNAMKAQGLLAQNVSVEQLQDMITEL